MTTEQSIPKEERLDKIYSELLPHVAQIQSQYLFTHGDFQQPILILARESLRKVCNEHNVDMVIIPDGDDCILLIQTKLKEIIFKIMLNVYTYRDYLDEREEYEGEQE